MPDCRVADRRRLVRDGRSSTHRPSPQLISGGRILEIVKCEPDDKADTERAGHLLEPGGDSSKLTKQCQ